MASYKPEFFLYQIGRPDGGGYSATVGTDRKGGYLAYGPYTDDVARGNGAAYFLLAVDNVAAYNHEVAVVDVVANKGRTRLGARIIYRHDFVRPNTIQQIGIPFRNLGYRDIEFRVQWLGTSYMRFHGVNVHRLGFPPDIICPVLGSATISKEWSVRGPIRHISNVWIDPAWSKIRDADGVRFYHRIEETLWQFGRACGLAFRKTAPGAAQYRFHRVPRDKIAQYSQAWNASDWWGDANLHSVYLAVHPNKCDLFTGTHTKPSQGSKLVHRINAMRFAQHALWYAMGWPYQDASAPIFAARSASMSMPFRYPTTWPNVTRIGLAGFDRREIDWLRAKYGPPWLHCFEAGW